MSRRAVVVGAGLGGLATALRLAGAGWRVQIFERSSSPGGKMNRWASQGYTFDTGPTLLTLRDEFEDLFNAIGQRSDRWVQWVPVEPQGACVFPDGTAFEISGFLPNWMATLRRLDPSAPQQWWTFFRHGAVLYELARRTFLAGAIFQRPDRDTLSLLRRIPMRLAWGVYHRAVERLFDSPYLRRMFDRFPTYVGSSPYATPGMLLVIPYIEQAYGSWYTRGGLYSLVEALVALGRTMDIEMALSAPVTLIERSASGRVQGVRLADGTRWPADVVVFNGDASRTSALLGERRGPALAPPHRSLSGFVLCLGLKRALPRGAHHTVFFSDDYEREFDQLFRQRTFPEDPTVYVCRPSCSDDSVSPPQGESLFIMANAPANGDEGVWDDVRTELAMQRVLRRLEASGFPIPSEAIAVRHVWTPRDLAAALDMPGGAIYGTNSHGWRGAFLRPSLRVRRCPGLYRVGGSVHPGGGTPMVLRSARLVTEMILRDVTS